MNRRQFVQLTTAGAASLALRGLPMPAQSATPTRRRPNIVFVFADQLRVHDISTYGGTAVAMPNLDRMAAEGARCDNAISTYPVCSAFRAMMLTGHQPWNNGMIVNDHFVLPRFHAPDGPTFGRLSDRAGYDTCYIGKWHVDGRGRSACIPRERRLGWETRWLALECTHDYNNSKYYEDDSCDIKTWPEYDAISQTKAAQRFIREHKDRPFNLTMSWGPPHDPYYAPDEYMAMYNTDTMPLRANMEHTEYEEECRAREPERWNFPPELQNIRDIIHGRMNSRQKRLDSLRGYYAATKLLDDLLGELRRTLEEEGILDNTIFVFSSDHGDQLFSHGFYGKQMPLEESIRVPLVVRYPEMIAPGTESDALVAPIDYMPTMLGMAGIDCPPCDGRNLAPALSGADTSDERDAVLIMRMAHLSNSWLGSGSPTFRGVRTKTHTYARTTDGEAWFLFDNMSDPYQMVNLAGRPEYADLQARLDRRTTELCAEANDPDDDDAVIDRILAENPNHGAVAAFRRANPKSQG